MNRGDVISLFTRNNDPNFGSIGNSEQHLKYLGSHRFEVLESSRSLEPGMLITTEVNVLKIDEQLNFSVIEVPGMDKQEVKGKTLIFRMRPIYKMELNKFNKKW